MRQNQHDVFFNCWLNHGLFKSHLFFTHTILTVRFFASCNLRCALSNRDVSVWLYCLAYCDLWEDSKQVKEALVKTLLHKVEQLMKTIKLHSCTNVLLPSYRSGSSQDILVKSVPDETHFFLQLFYFMLKCLVIPAENHLQWPVHSLL